MRTLEIRLSDTLVGRIVENRKGGRFAYEPDIVERYSGLPVLSLSLPAKKRPFGESKTENWFSGLLPEGTRRQDICRSLGLSEYDWIGLLANIGWECAGAVRIREEGDSTEHDASYEPISKEQLAQQLSDISARMPQRSTGAFRMSLDGFQEKICVTMPCLPKDGGDIDLLGLIDSGQVLQPIGDAASTHILKPENSRSYPGSAESEAWAMTVAGNAASCARVGLLRLDEAPDTLVVERYDRAGTSWPDCVTRIHQEDACQAMGLSPSSKYAATAAPKGDDPTYRAVAKLLQTYASDPQAQMAELLRQITVNMAIGNWDAHAKNISFLYASPMVPTVAPMYDVVPIAEVEQRTKLLSLRIAGSLEPEAITAEKLIEEASGWGMRSEVAADVVSRCLADLEGGLESAAALYPNAAARHEKHVRERISRLK